MSHLKGIVKDMDANSLDWNRLPIEASSPDGNRSQFDHEHLRQQIGAEAGAYYADFFDREGCLPPEKPLPLVGYPLYHGEAIALGFLVKVLVMVGLMSGAVVSYRTGIDAVVGVIGGGLLSAAAVCIALWIIGHLPPVYVDTRKRQYRENVAHIDALSDRLVSERIERLN